MNDKELLIKQLRRRKHHLKVLQGDFVIVAEQLYRPESKLLIEISENIGFKKGQIDITEDILVTEYNITDKELKEKTDE